MNNCKGCGTRLMGTARKTVVGVPIFAYCSTLCVEAAEVREALRHKTRYKLTVMAPSGKAQTHGVIGSYEEEVAADTLTEAIRLAKIEVARTTIFAFAELTIGTYWIGDDPNAHAPAPKPDEWGAR